MPDQKPLPSLHERAPNFFWITARVRENPVPPPTLDAPWATAQKQTGKTFMARIVTHAEVSHIPDGGVLQLEDGAELTPLALERARARQLVIQHTGQALAPSDLPSGDTALLIERVTQQVVSRMGTLTPDLVDRVVAEVMTAVKASSAPVGLPAAVDYCATLVAQNRHREHRRAVITTTGRNQKGIVAKLTTVVAELGGDILDISQTLVGDYFTMLLIVDIGDLVASFADFKSAIQQACDQLGVQAILMHEDMVRSLHRV